MTDIILASELKPSMLTQGSENQSRNMLGVDNDVAAINEWLRRSCSNSDHTFSSYHREAERLYVFSREIGKTLAELDVRDINDFYNLLRNPPKHWIIPNQYTDSSKKGLTHTQLLRGKLSASSLAQTKTILKGLFNYLNDAGYVRGNCIALAQKIKKPTKQSTNYKALSIEAWNYLENWLDKRVQREVELVEKTKAVRDRWVVHLAYNTGMRKSSIISSYMSDIYPREINKKRYWHINFIMKGNKENSVLLSEEAIFRLKEYRTYLGLSEYPSLKETDIPVVHSLNHMKRNIQTDLILDALSGQGISSDGLNIIIRDALNLAKNDCEDEWIKAELSTATPHTFRHTCATHRLLHGASIESTQETLGHSSIQTTMIYTHLSKELLLEQQNKVSMNRKRKAP